LPIGPFQEGDPLGLIVSLLFYMSFISFMFFGQKIQLRIVLWEVSRTLVRLELMRSEARHLALKRIEKVGKPKEDPTHELDTLLEHFMITPVDLDPRGIVWKLDHLLDVRDAKFKDDVKRIAPEADETQINNLENLVEAALSLNSIYRVVRHFYLFGKRTSSFYLVVQLQMLLPLIMEMAEGMAGATKAFAEGHPIGDGVGALVASKLMLGKEKRRIEKDIVVAETMLEGRRILVLKAEGPGGNVGKPGDAIRRLVEENEGKVAIIVMVDAAVKFEGENRGEISEGVGAAIGGFGTERYKIEEEIQKYKIPIHAIIIKESIQDAVTTMKREVCAAADEAISRIKRVVLERTKEGDNVIVAGVGNTIGIGQ